MGRHRATKINKPVGIRVATARPVLPQGRSPELLAWGVFLTAVAVVAMLWVEVPWGTVTAASALLFLAFGLSWFFARPRTTTAAATAVAAQDLPAPAVRAPAAPAMVPAPAPPTVAVASPPSPAPAPAPASQHARARSVDRPRNAPHGRRAAAAPVFHDMPAEPSRWTRTFGPPDTGQIPLQPYLSGVPASYATADNDLPDRRQRSHSSL
ncbi:hypothetical protein NNX28_11275 [Arthrobacter sp. zg-Y859]|uniref:Uncharacterized protein n=1 Tax=Arthrobacter jinronghuae TaxID=2964609 RepID=A0ABT1NSE3_9MICC|nr:hypothetical protein [Arthrobacter jinronghuae]MCQ1950507.1 hypothetical protein [Arthrobacter jinronghuae]UWX77477.1 hypothetical protein N2K98_10765 [Arthrobacter jinronghuae]